MRKLLEGMRGGDLEDMILPFISVDEFESKIDDTAVVVAFFVQEHAAAEDLNRFIQRSPTEILDSEISPAPDQHGYFMVFVELLKNDQFARNVGALLEEIAPLANIKTWKMQVRGHDDLTPFSEDALDEMVEDRAEQPIKESILGYLTTSDLRHAELIGTNLVLEGANGRFEFAVEAFGDADAILRERGLHEAAVALDLRDVARCHHIATGLGEGWSVHRIGEFDFVHRLDAPEALLLRS